MIKLFSSENRLAVQQIKDLLDDHQIPYFIKNEFAIGAVGELSPLDAWPEVWLVDAEWQTRAERLIAQFQQWQANHSERLRSQSNWFCWQCGEENEANFELCWYCSHERPHDPADD